MAAVIATAAGADEGVGFRVSAGWLSVMDVPGVQKVTSADPKVVAVSSVADDQVVLLGVEEGVATVSVWALVGGVTRRTDFDVTVLNNTTVQKWDGLVGLSVGHRTALAARGLTRLEVGDAAICDATPAGPDGFELSPRRPGTTTLLVWAGGRTPAHRRQLLITVSSGGIARSSTEVDATLTEPRTGRLVLLPGEHAIVDLPPKARFAVKDEAVVVARSSDDGELILEGRLPGATRLLVWAGTKRARSLFVVVHPRAPADAPVDDPLPPPDPAPIRQQL